MKFPLLKAFYIVCYVSTSKKGISLKESGIKTEQWLSYKPLKKDFPHITYVASSKKSNNFSELHRVKMEFKDCFLDNKVQI